MLEYCIFTMSLAKIKWGEKKNKKFSSERQIHVSHTASPARQRVATAAQSGTTCSERASAASCLRGPGWAPSSYFSFVKR